ncbi:hypothetical protein PEBR_29580 [Penicillium brasilianum]|uniref:Uncharacterized protein n=1 Tax=Penicillium brasilianum TaxID=104259 RepID=A0A1S9RGE1_PENBI|nr:hypothetical protein PEBR_29580 [Penicillium brasilianum]
MAEGWMTTNKVDDVLTLITAVITMVLFLRKIWKWTGKWRERLLTWLQQIGRQQTGGQQGDLESQTSPPTQADAIDLPGVPQTSPRDDGGNSSD